MESLRKPVKMLKEERQRLAPRHVVAIIFACMFVLLFRSTNAAVARPQQTVATANANDDRRNWSHRRSVLKRVASMFLWTRPASVISMESKDD